jgi:hypothetical protein
VTTGARRRAGAVLVGLLTLVAGLEWRRVFDGGRLVPLVVAAAILPTVLAIVLGGRSGGRSGGRAGRPLPVTVTASVALLVAFVFAAVLQAPDTSALADGVLSGWSRILTTTLPVPPRPSLLVLPVVTTWLAALVGSEVALRARYPALAPLAPVTAYGVALLFGVGGPGSRVAPAAAALAAALAAAAALAGPADDAAAGAGFGPDAGPGGYDGRPGTVPGAEPGRNGHDPAGGGRPRRSVARAVGDRRPAVLSRKGVSAAILVLACALGAAVIGPRLPASGGRTPYDPREDQRPPVDDLVAIDPLSLLAGWATTPDDVLFTVRADRAQRWRLAVLDDYAAGRGWSREAELRPAGQSLPAGPGSADTGDAADTEDLAQDITIESLRGVWLPAADRAVRVTDVTPLVDPETGVLVRREELEGGLRYRVTSSVPAGELDCTRAPAGRLGSGDTVVGLPSDLVELAQSITEGETSPCARARAIEAYLTSNEFAFSADAPSGSTLARVKDLLRPRDEGQGTGTSEQFATAFALLARAVGLPTRVVVGFHGGTEVDGTYEVRAGDAFAWPEVRFEGLGWMAFDPTPVPGDRPPPAEIAEAEIEQSPDPAAGSATSSTTTTTIPVVEHDRPPPAPAEEGPGPVARAITLLGVAVAAVTGALVAVAGAVAGARRWRRRRRRSPTDPARRALGAWRQCVEELQAAGVRPEPSDTAAEFVARSRDVVGDRAAEVAGPVARMANGVLFGDAPATDADAAAAWRAAADLAEATAAGRSPADRLRHALDVRALVG